MRQQLFSMIGHCGGRTTHQLFEDQPLVRPREPRRYGKVSEP
jgi:hypothetical protein